MSFTLLLVISVISQALGQTVTTTRTVRTQTVVSNAATSTSSSNANAGVTISIPIQELQSEQARILQLFQQQSASIAQTSQGLQANAGAWYFGATGLRSAFDESMSSLNGLMDQANSYLQGAEKLMTALRTAGGPGVQLQWIERVRKLQGLGELALLRAADGITSVTKSIGNIDRDQQVYNEAKQAQLVETKAQMDATLEKLLQQTLQVGVQASGVMRKALADWSAILRKHLGSEASTEVLARLQEVAGTTLNDLSRLRPEDIESSMSDAHRCIEDIKGIFYSAGVPAAVVRQAVNPVQLGVFATLTRARAIHL